MGRWVERETSSEFRGTGTRYIGLQAGKEIVAGVVYEDFNGRSVVCHWAIRGRVTRDFLWYIHYYPFKELEAHKVIAPVHSSNDKMMRIAPKMGFVEEGRLVNTQPNGDIVLFTLTADKCRYLGERYGKIKPAGTSGT